MITQAMAAYGEIWGPKSSKDRMLAAIGVLAAPARRLTKPIAENVAT
jgi:alkylhydroperoxidase/carboxymuconolactone decarboxylase family protein YurZ